MSSINRSFARVLLGLGTVLPASLLAQGTPVPPMVNVPLAFTGEVRTRSEWDAPGGLSSDAFTYLRTRFGVRVDPAPGTMMYVQLQDSRVLGTEGNSVSGTMDVFDLHQGYLQLSGKTSGYDLSARAGRQEISLGNERLVGAVNWSNTGRSFDGIRASMSPSAASGTPWWSATAFGAIVEEHGRRFGGSAAGTPDHSMAGAFLSAQRESTAGDVTLLYDGGLRYRNYAEANRATIDGRLRSRVARLQLEVEGAFQAGHQHSLLADTTKFTPQDVRAWLVGTRVRLAAGNNNDLVIGADALSGDDTPGDGTYSAFSSMFATNHSYYGLMDVIGDPAASTRERGLLDVFGMVTSRWSSRFVPRGELHRFALGTDRAGLLGVEADVVAPLTLASGSVVELGYSAFRSGSSSTIAGLGAAGVNRQWLYLQLRAGF